jgi:hypothetical protein
MAGIVCYHGFVDRPTVCQLTKPIPYLGWLFYFWTALAGLTDVAESVQSRGGIEAGTEEIVLNLYQWEKQWQDKRT